MMKIFKFAWLVLLVLVIALSATAGGGKKEEPGDDPVISTEGVFSVDPVLVNSCIGIEVRLAEDEALAGIRWFNNDDQAGFAKLLVTAGLPGQAPLYEGSLTVAADFSGQESDWSELQFSEPLAAETDVLHVIFQLPEYDALTDEGQGPGLGYSYEETEGTDRAFLSSDGVDWVQVQAGCRVLCEPILTEREPGMTILAVNTPDKAKEDEKDLPRVTALDRPYPNPCNPLTKVAFSLHKAVEVKLQVFDVRGRLVRTLAEGSHPAGRYVVEWSGVNNQGSQAASGVYFIRLRTPERDYSERVVLLK